MRVVRPPFNGGDDHHSSSHHDEIQGCDFTMVDSQQSISEVGDTQKEEEETKKAKDVPSMV